MVYQSCEQFAEGVADWRRAISIGGGNAYYCYGLAACLIKLAEYDEAERILLQAIDLGDKNGTYRRQSGSVYTFQQKFEQALPRFAFDPNDPNVRGVEWAQRAYFCLCTGKTDDALNALAQAKSRETFPARAYRIPVEYYRTADQFEKAIQEFSASTSLEEYPPGYRQRAVTYLTMGQVPLSLHGFDEITSTQFQVFYNAILSRARERKLGMKKEAAEHIAKAF